jgi:hypothetical protein
MSGARVQPRSGRRCNYDKWLATWVGSHFSGGGGNRGRLKSRFCKPFLDSNLRKWLSFGKWTQEPEKKLRSKAPSGSQALRISNVYRLAPVKTRGRYYLYLRQNGLWTKDVTGFDPAAERAKLHDCLE